MKPMTIDSPWLRRFLAYILERFPPVNGLLFLIFYLTSTFFTLAMDGKTGPLPIGSLLVPGFLAVYGFFFHLRVFDEHKDFSNDMTYHPTRVLQSGLITLRDLRITGAVAIATEALVSFLISPLCLALWLVCFLYSLLMLKEFFVPEWLNRHFVLYALSHMLIMPLLVIWISSMAAEQIPMEILIIALLSFLSGMAFELSRKIKAPGDERDGVMTYSKLLTPQRAALMALLCLVFSSFTLGYLLYNLYAPAWLIELLCVLTLLTSLVFINFIRTLRHARRLELGSSLFMLAAYAAIVGYIVWTRGL